MAIQLGTDTVKNGGSFDIVIVNGSSALGFILASQSAGVKQQVNNTAPSFTVGTASAYNQDAFPAVAWPGTLDGGDKQLLESGENRYDTNDGAVATQYPDFLTLASQWNSTDATQVATAREVIDYPVGDTYVLLGVGAKCRAYNLNSQTWANSGSFGGNVVNLATDGTYVWAAIGTTEAYWRLTNTTWAQPASGVKATCFCFWNTKLYRALGRNLFVSSNQGASIKGWGAAIPVGRDSTNITYLFDGGPVLLIAKPEGLYTWDGTVIKTLIDAKTSVSTGNFVGGAMANGRIYAPQLQDVLEIGLTGNGTLAGAPAITPRMKGSAAKERYGHGTPKMATQAPNGVYIAFHQGQGTYPEVLYYNGRGGWHQVYLGSASTNMNAFGFSQLAGWLVVNDGSTRYKRVTNIGNSEYPDFAATGVITSPRIDGGYPLLSKSWRSVTLDLDSATSTETVKVSYSLDGASYVDAETLVSSGVKEVPLGGSLGTVEGKTIQIKLTLSRSGGDITLTPRIKWPIIVSGLPSNKATDMTNLSVVVDSEHPTRTQGELGDYASTQAYNEFLDDIREAGSIAVCNQHNKWSIMRLTNYAEIPKTLIGRPGDAPREYKSAELTLLDLFPGLERTVENVAVVTCVTSTEAA